MNNDVLIVQQNNLNKAPGVAVLPQYPPKLINYPSTPNVLQVAASPSQP